ncbi:ABC transporter substrate-binding protein [Deinococcus antarcticus]|uniref:ABC transporter substrate-binding protein n=1 Tax=Deinococcus antarcticus TaxID=1298767 RepID=A0ABV8AAW7_9DEIO
MKKRLLTALLLGSGSALADINVGVIVSATGPGASLGIPEKNAVALLPTTIGGQKINYIVLDDASDPTVTVSNANKLIQDSKVDVIIGASLSTTAMALLDPVSAAKVPNISLAPNDALITPMDAKRKWVFKMPQSDSLLADATVKQMKARGVKTLGFIGFNDAYGENWIKELTPLLAKNGIKMVATERFARTDTAVTGQALKIAASGVPATLPIKTLRQRGFAGTIYAVAGVANADFLRVGGKDVEGVMVYVGPIVVGGQLPDALPSKKVSVAFTKLYEDKYGAGSISAFAGHVWDAGLMLQKAIPAALKSARPGTPEFREALRDSLEGLKNVIGTHGVFAMSGSNHNGMDQRARVLAVVQNGDWKYVGR